MKAIRFVSLPLLAVVTAGIGAAPERAQQAAEAGEWRAYHRDLAGTRYSPLDRIDSSNVSRLDVAWTFTPDSSAGGRELKNENTPLVVNGVMYLTAGTGRAVIAADPASGHTKWLWRMDEGRRAAIAPRRNSGRGVAYWSRGAEERIFTVTPGFQLVALDARTGKPVDSFGEKGVVDLKLQLGVPLHVDSARIGNSSPPLVFENIVVVGPALEVGTAPRSMNNVPGRILALDAVTGKLLWRFNTIPQDGEFGIDTWENDSWRYTGNTGAWAPLSLDEKRGYLYVPTEAATGDYFGGHRHGDNLFSTSLVCLDVRTGKRIWHYQTVHHDIWDMDNTTAPILTDITVGGRRIEAVALMTKQAFTFVLDRESGEPVWPIEERPVPQSDVPGEKTSPTQPHPTKPPPFDRQGITESDLIDFTPALRAEAVELIKRYRTGPLFTPPSLSNSPDGTRGTLVLPNVQGGANWEHGAFDPETGILYAASWTSPSVITLQPGGNRSDMSYVAGLGGSLNVQGLPLIKPPWSRITAIDLNEGVILWTAAAGEMPERYRNHPALQGIEPPRTGSVTRPVVLATKTLLFQGEGFGGGAKLHALNKRTGEVVWEMTLPAPVTSSPMTYMHGGRQYVAFWVGGGQTPATLMALSIPGGNDSNGLPRP